MTFRERELLDATLAGALSDREGGAGGAATEGGATSTEEPRDGTAVVLGLEEEFRDGV